MMRERDAKFRKDRPRRVRGPAGGQRGAAPFRRSGGGSVVLYGWHSVKAALENPARKIRGLWATENAARRLAEDGVALDVAPEIVRPDVIANRLSADAVHNGLMPKPIP